MQIILFSFELWNQGGWVSNSEFLPIYDGTQLEEVKKQWQLKWCILTHEKDLRLTVFLTGLDKHWMIRGIPPHWVTMAAFAGSAERIQ